LRKENRIESSSQREGPPQAEAIQREIVHATAANAMGPSS
jgi:hypothetical protein